MHHIHSTTMVAPKKFRPLSEYKNLDREIILVQNNIHIRQLYKNI